MNSLRPNNPTYEFKISELRYIALFVVSKSIKKVFSIMSVFIFSQYFFQ